MLNPLVLSNQLINVIKKTGESFDNVNQDLDYYFVVIDENGNIVKTTSITPSEINGNTTLLKIKTDLSINWINNNSVLSLGEIGFESDTNQFKIGDGILSYNSLSYFVDKTKVVNKTGESLSTFSKSTPLYNWYVTQGSIAPTGWRVPSDSDWNTLITFLGGDTVAGGKLKTSGTTYWNSPNTDATNDVGFNALPLGFRNFNDGLFGNIGNYCFWWSSTEYADPYYANYQYVSYSSADISNYHDPKRLGIGVRLVSDSLPTEPIVDFDGNVYTYTKIGEQYWMQQDWKCTHYTDGTEIPNVTDDTQWSALTTGALCYYNNTQNTYNIVVEDNSGNIVKTDISNISTNLGLSNYQTKLNIEEGYFITGDSNGNPVQSELPYFAFL